MNEWPASFAVQSGGSDRWLMVTSREGIFDRRVLHPNDCPVLIVEPDKVPIVPNLTPPR